MKKFNCIEASLKLLFLLLVIGLITKPEPLLAANPTAKPSVSKSRNTLSKPAKNLKRLEIKLSTRKVTLYQGKKPIKSYRVAVGRRGWETPTGKFKVKNMVRNPTWISPFTGAVIPGGTSKNPLGQYWIGFWTNGKNWIGFHGTPSTASIGKAASHGCIRMYNRDVQELFKQVKIGTPVTVVK
ncbi:MAG TPA: L,D-transpeptidase [Oculatellaceae cyanobacterium]|jgi:lipoprotein-anchoring transpeptidase ErfK/SrfK